MRIVLRDAKAILVKNSQVELGGQKAGSSRALDPFGGFNLVGRDSLAEGVGISKIVLSEGIAMFGRTAQIGNIHGRGQRGAGLSDCSLVAELNCGLITLTGRGGGLREEKDCGKNGNDDFHWPSLQARYDAVMLAQGA